MATAFGDSGDDHVGAGADRRGVATEVGSQEQRPPQTVLPDERSVAHQLVDHRSHRRHVRNVVHHRRDHGGAPQQQHHRAGQAVTSGIAQRRGEIVDGAGLDQRSDDQKQAGEKQQRLPPILGRQGPGLRRGRPPSLTHDAGDGGPEKLRQT